MVNKEKQSDKIYGTEIGFNKNEEGLIIYLDASWHPDWDKNLGTQIPPTESTGENDKIK